MNEFRLDKYRYPSREYLEIAGRPERERYLMAIAQKYFDEHSAKESVSLGSERDECICLERDGVLLAVYFSERGGKNLIALFKSIYDVLDYLAARCLGIPKLPLDWVALNQEFDRRQAKTLP